MARRGGKIKRTKTFTGCSTCRSRGVKCGEEKPACLRCRSISLVCGGYGVSLVWPGGKEAKSPQRRIILPGYKPDVQAMSEEKLSTVLECIDAAAPGTSLSVYLFGVFPACQSLSLSKHGETRTVVKGNYPLVPLDEKYETLFLIGRIRERENYSRTGNLPLRLEPSLYNSLPISCREDRQLMHYWIAHLSPLMIPTERLDNPFQLIIVPLALSAIEDQQESSGRKALLHSIYSLAAFSRANCRAFSNSARQNQHVVGTRHLQLALHKLSQSLIQANYEHPEAVLASIVILVLIGVFTENYSNFRVHIRGGANWIRSIDKSTWRTNRDASTMYQLFTGIEALRPAHRYLARDLAPQNLSLEHLSLEGSTPSTDGSFSGIGFLADDDNTYCLDRFFSITKPILESIMELNRLIFTNTRPNDDEIIALELKIVMNNPATNHLPSSTSVSEKLAHHHACMWYLSTQIYFRCFLLKLPPSEVQWLVKESTEHIEAIESLEADLNVSGLLWPSFIAGCEADTEELRGKIVDYFTKRETLGVANVHAAKRVVLEVWRRRDQLNGAANVSWHGVMADLGIDILLS